MKIKYLVFILTVFSVFLGVSLLLSEDIPLTVITSPKVFSIKHTELHDQFKISVLMNRNDTYHLDTGYISRSIIIDGDNHVPIEVEKIEVSNDKMNVGEEEYYLVNFVVSMKISSNDHLVQYEEASLEITYENNQMMDLYIGEFNYLFSEDADDLSLYTLKGTFGDINGVNTVTGIAIELFNKSTSNIIIKRIDIVSKDVSLNNDYLVEKDRDIDMFESVEDILLIDAYHFDSYESEETYHSIRTNQSKKLYIPILYNSDIKHISRFVVSVTYEMDGEIKVFNIDDFIFMNHFHFGVEYEDNYRVYQYEDYVF